MNQHPEARASGLSEALSEDVRCQEFQIDTAPLFIEPEGNALLDRECFRAWTRHAMPVLKQIITRHGGFVLQTVPYAGNRRFADIINRLPPFQRLHRRTGTNACGLQGAL